MKYIRRLVWFIASRLLIFTICVSVLLCAFYMCMNTANVYIVLNDGLEKRVDVILTREDAPELNNYFHGDFLSADPALTAPLAEMCATEGIPVEQEQTMEELGKAAGIQVGAAVVALLRV